MNDIGTYQQGNQAGENLGDKTDMKGEMGLTWSGQPLELFKRERLLIQPINSH